MCAFGKGFPLTAPTGLNHVAMSVPSGALTHDYRAELLEFYGGLFGWREIESLRLPDRLTIRVGKYTYVNVRERPDPMMCSGYEHFGIVVSSNEEAEELWRQLDADPRDVNLEPLTDDDNGVRSFRFRHLLPLTVEVQSFQQT
jgi:hypothetical protein